MSSPDPRSDGRPDTVPPAAASAHRGAASPLPERKSAASTVSPDRTRWYVQSVFAYTNQLMERMQVRCNYLILANSVALVAFSSILNSLLANRGKTGHLLSRFDALLLALLPSAMFLFSLVVAVVAFLPRIYDYEIQLNHEFIGRLSPQRYRQFVDEKDGDSQLADFVDEINVLSRILNDRSRRVDTAARLFITAIVLMLIVIASAVV
jgi:hypothetical protein